MLPKILYRKCELIDGHGTMMKNVEARQVRVHVLAGPTEDRPQLHELPSRLFFIKVGEVHGEHKNNGIKIIVLKISKLRMFALFTLYFENLFEKFSMKIFWSSS